MATFLGIELGSTRIKAVQIDETFQTIAAGSYAWSSSLRDGIWTYDLEEAWHGVRQAVSELSGTQSIACMGVSGMMHGYLAFDKDWNLLTPFRTWQNTITAEAAARLTEVFSFNIPQRWSIAHLYQAVLDQEAHVAQVAHITTLAGYIHYMLTGENILGIGDASGMFPIDSSRLDYDQEMLARFEALTRDQPWRLRDLLPRVVTAGSYGGRLTSAGASRLGGKLPAGLLFAPPESDAGTGMASTNATAPRTGNISAGTSIFAMVVLERPLSRVYPEIDMVTTPSGRPVAMVHCNNCTGDMNAWIGVLREATALFGLELTDDELFTKLYQKSLEAQPDCGGVLVCNYTAGEGVTHLDEGRPFVLRRPGSAFTLANFMRANLYSAAVTLRLGMEILWREQVDIDVLMGHGGLFKTPLVGQRYMAAACRAAVTCLQTAGEGGPYGMALLAAYCVLGGGRSLDEFLAREVFAETGACTVQPEEDLADGFTRYTEAFSRALVLEKTALEVLPWT